MGAPPLAAEGSGWNTPGYVLLAGSSPHSPGAIVCRRYAAGRLRRLSIRGRCDEQGILVREVTMAARPLFVGWIKRGPREDMNHSL